MRSEVRPPGNTSFKSSVNPLVWAVVSSCGNHRAAFTNSKWFDCRKWVTSVHNTPSCWNCLLFLHENVQAYNTKIWYRIQNTKTLAVERLLIKGVLDSIHPIPKRLFCLVTAWQINMGVVTWLHNIDCQNILKGSWQNILWLIELCSLNGCTTIILYVWNWSCLLYTSRCV